MSNKKSKKSPTGTTAQASASAAKRPTTIKPATIKQKPNSAGSAKGAGNGQQLQPRPSPVHPGDVANVCVYCGSGPGTKPIYAQSARILGESLAASGIGLVYGGGGLGLMGEVARATLGAGGHVTGIIPEFLTQKEHMLHEVQTLHITQDMHERKRLMFEKSDAFVALPGGVGTLEELVEQLTWSQLGRHRKPIVVANIAGFWEPFLSLLAHMRDDQFIRNGINVRFIVVDTADAIVPSILAATRATRDDVPDAVITAKF